jgi:hypothetical protein
MVHFLDGAGFHRRRFIGKLRYFGQSHQHGSGAAQGILSRNLGSFG